MFLFNGMINHMSPPYLAIIHPRAIIIPLQPTAITKLLLGLWVLDELYYSFSNNKEYNPFAFIALASRSNTSSSDFSVKVKSQRYAGILLLLN